VFGPVVNLASRLEGLTKFIRVPVLIDEVTSSAVRGTAADHTMRLRRLAKVIPFGTESPVALTELLPPQQEGGLLTDEEIGIFERAADEFAAGRWEEAYRLLHRLPADDRALDFLSQQIVSSGRVAPPDWDGVIRAPAK